LGGKANIGASVGGNIAGGSLKRKHTGERLSCWKEDQNGDKTRLKHDHKWRKREAVSLKQNQTSRRG